MASNIKSFGVDLDSLFMARSTTKRANVGWQVGGIDISNRYQEYTTGTKVSLTKLLSGNNDLANLFQNISVPLPPVYTVTLSGQTIEHNTIPGDTAVAAIRFNSDGTVDQGIDGIFSQIDSITDWIIPNVEADSTFDVRCTGVGGSWTSSPIADGSWINLGTSRTWTVQRISTEGTNEVTATFEIRKDGGAALDSGFYTVRAVIQV